VSLCLVGLVAPVGCSNEDGGSDTLCSLARQQHASGEHETDPPAIRALVRELPAGLRYDAALYYYPYGGDVRSDADGVQAEEAGERLLAYYKKACGVDFAG
jgi:hypothetical protein